MFNCFLRLEENLFVSGTGKSRSMSSTFYFMRRLSCSKQKRGVDATSGLVCLYLIFLFSLLLCIATLESLWRRSVRVSCLGNRTRMLHDRDKNASYYPSWAVLMHRIWFNGKCNTYKNFRSKHFAEKPTFCGNIHQREQLTLCEREERFF